MAANLIDILINAKWIGGAALKGVSGDLRQLGDNAAKTSLEMGIAAEKTRVFNSAVRRLSEAVVDGKISLEQATETLEALNKELGEVAKKAPKAQKGFAGFGKVLLGVSVGLAAATVAAKQLFEVIEEGAERQLVQERFDRLAVSIGTTGEALGGDLSGAVKGLIPDMKALAVATDLMAQGLATSHDEAVQLTGISAELNLNMNQLISTLTDQTTAGFDALGISVVGFEDKVNALEDAGHNADEAFNLAFIEQAGEQIETVGSHLEITAGKLAIIGSSWTDTMDDIKVETVSAFEPIISLLADTIIATKDAEIAVRELGSAIGDLGDQEAAVKAVGDAIREIGILGLANVSNVVATQGALHDLIVELSAGGETIEEQIEILESFGFTIDQVGLRFRGMKVDWESLNVLLEESRGRAALFFLAEQAGKADEKLFLMGTTVKRTSDLFDELGEFTEKGVAALEKAIEKTDELSVSLLDMGNIQTPGQLVGVIGRQIQDALDESFEIRADIFLDFESNLTEITAKESERRTEIEAEFEERRTEIVESFGRRRSTLEERAARNIDRIQGDSADKQLQIRADGNDRLADLERDHLDRIKEIIENADLELQEAAGRLDAKAVARIQRQREDALGDETDAFKKQRGDIQKQIDKQIKREQEAAAKRIKREEENNALRLAEMDRAHEEQLEALKDKHDDELQDIKDNAIQARQAAEDQYIQERIQLDNHNRAKTQQETAFMNQLLQREAEFWRTRIGLIGGGDADPVSSGDGDTTTDSGAGGQKPSRFQLEQMAIRVAAKRGDDAIEMSRYFKTLSTIQLVDWIKANSDLDVPGYAHGGRVTRTGLTLVGEGGPELLNLQSGTDIISPSLTRQFFQGAGGVNIGELNVTVNESDRPGDTGQEVREELERFFRSMA